MNFPGSVLLGTARETANASSITPPDYNVTYLSGISYATFDSSGNLVGEISTQSNYSSPIEEYTYTTSGPDAGRHTTTTIPAGSDPLWSLLNPKPSFNPGPLPGEQNSVPLVANSAGQQIGTSFAVSGITQTAQHGYLYSGGQMIPLVPTGASGQWSSDPIAINQVGQVVFNGYVYGNGSAQHAYLYSGGTTTDLGALGSGDVYADGLNNKGQVVGMEWLGPQSNVNTDVTDKSPERESRSDKKDG
jgi:probable HAF family extracellular repeat protein